MNRRPPSRPDVLAEQVRALLAEDGRPPSRRTVSRWIRAGAVRVDGLVLRNPDAVVGPAARIALDLDGLAEPVEPDLFTRSERARTGRERRGEPAGSARSATSREAAPAWLLHADAQLVVVDRAAFPGALSPPDLAQAVARALDPWRGRAQALHPVVDPSAPGSGPVLLATSRSVASRLSAEVRAGRVLETLLCLRATAGDLEEGLERGTCNAGGAPLDGALVQRDHVPLGTSTCGAAPDLVPPHRALLVLKHPRTNRRLELACPPCAAFSAALSCSRLQAG